FQPLCVWKTTMMTIQAKQKLIQEKMARMIKLSTPSGTKTSDDADGAKKEEIENDSTENKDIKPSSFGLRPKHSSVNINSDKWLLTMDEESQSRLENPPSIADGIDRATEEDLRYLGCELIQTGALLLKLPQTAAATGQIIFQRFYYSKSFAVHHFEHVVMACLYLASKIEEAIRRPRDIINVFHRLEQLHRLRRAGRLFTRPRHGRRSLIDGTDNVLRLGVPLLDHKYIQAKEMMKKTESKILIALGFVVHVKHPHKLIFSYIHTLNLSDRKDLVQKAWSYINDGLRTDMFLRYTPETIACACIFLAARTVEPPVALPSEPFHWFELFDASDRDVEAIAHMLVNLYNRKLPNWTALQAVVEKAHEAKMPKKDIEDEKKKAEEVAAKIIKEGKEKNGESNGKGDRRDRSRSRSYDRRRGNSPRGGRRRDDRDGRRDEKREKERDRRDKDRGRNGRDDGRRERRDEKKERRREERSVKEGPRMREGRDKETFSVFGKRPRDESPPRRR
ncbi:cyl-1, partial [Pristionchus pacificus]|uniref:Cyl-1 n=1 Tax=Pristionchus pacificus TaxID=54126 RepID=A0A2A6CAP5_PRIPA